MGAFEKLGMFYLGKVFDHKKGELSDDFALYESKDLVTHAVCVGMTGSGKTGLCVGLLEEAAIDNIPAIVIDPKGDLGNLLLTFPDLKGSDFLPWVNPDEAAQKGLSAKDFADQQAALWKKGLAGHGQDGKRIRRMKEAADFAIYTPGSSAGLPVSIVNSFQAPKGDSSEDSDQMRERIQTTTSGLLELLGIKADPLQSREHILLSNIIENAWSNGKDLDLGDLIQMIQSPPVTKIGVFDLESFYPAKDRFKLAMTMNNLLAAPGFKSWMEGEPLEIDNILYTEDGKARVSIFSIAHLSDSERMFFVTLLLNQVLGWMRKQSGTTSLRALLYMDEVFGFFPPIGEPPSKRPLLTMLKQARAFGLGVVLATQNPVDLDYKGLSNTGTWFIGRLQTEKDQERLLDGLSSAAGSGLDKKTLKNLIGGLKKRVFLLHNVHEKQPMLFGTRWVMSYLRGPLTRDHIKTLMKDRLKGKPAAKAKAAKTNTAKAKAAAAQSGQPTLPPGIRQYHAPLTAGLADDETLCYHPYLVAGGDVQIHSSRYNVAESNGIGHALSLNAKMKGVFWEDSQPVSFAADLFGGDVAGEAQYLPLPADVVNPKRYTSLDKKYETFVYRNYVVTLFQSKMLKQVSRPGESERDFRVRLNMAAHERRDLEMDRLRRKYASKIATLERQLLTAQQRVEREEDQYQEKKLDAAISFGTTILGGLFGGRSSRRGISSSARKASRISKEKQDIARAEEKLRQIQERMADVEADLNDQIEEISQQFDPMTEVLAEVKIKPRKSDVLQRQMGIVWIPYGHRQDGTSRPLYNGLGAG